MKKNIGVVLVLAVFLCGAALGFAQEPPKPDVKPEKPKMEFFQGKIIGLNRTKSEIVMKDDRSQATRVFLIDPKVISSLNIGDDVKVKAQAGSIKAQRVVRLKSRKR